MSWRPCTHHITCSHSIHRNRATPALSIFLTRVSRALVLVHTAHLSKVLTYLRVGGLYIGALDFICVVRPVGRADGEAQRLQPFERSLRPERQQLHEKVDRGRRSDVAGRLWSWYQRPVRHLPSAPPPHPWFHHATHPLSWSRLILVRRSKSAQSRTGAPETVRGSTATTSSKRVFGGAWLRSSPVRLRSLTHRLPSHAADRTLSAHMAGPSSRLRSSHATILGFMLPN